MEYIKLDFEYFSTLEEIQHNGLINFTKTNSANNKKILNLIKAGKVIDGYDENLGYIVKPMAEALGDNYHSESRLCYWLEEANNDFRSSLKKKLLVLFAPFPSPSNVSAKKRMSENMWDNLSKHLTHNTYILRIADSSLMSGSWFMNTKYFPDYEQRVQKLIKRIASDYGIPEENIVLYGESRGAVGALLHGILGKFLVVSYDPIFDLVLSDFKKPEYDVTLSGEMLPDNFILYFNYLLSRCKSADSWKRKILTCSKIKTTFPAIQKLDQEKVEVINVNFFDREDFDEGINFAHTKFIINNYPLVLSYLNKFLYSCDIN